jgi:hypothetical protein
MLICVFMFFQFTFVFLLTAVSRLDLFFKYKVVQI